MTNTEKLIALQSCVYGPCTVTGFQATEWGETARLYLSNGLVLEVKTDDLSVRGSPDKSDEG
jgi:hypothetical protein